VIGHSTDDGVLSNDKISLINKSANGGKNAHCSAFALA